jgi:nucleotide-binding universal stress UspA family protein
MVLRDILVFLDGGDTGEERLRLATNIAREHGSRLSAIFLRRGQATDLPFRRAAPWLGHGAGLPIPGAIVTSQITTPAVRAEQLFRDRFHSLKMDGDWCPVNRVDVNELVSFARGADLVIIGQINPDTRPVSSWRPEEIVIGCGRPVLMVPYIGSYPQVGRRVLVAWDGSREAARALNDALPLIQGADSVTLVTVRTRVKDLNHNSLSMDPIVRHLARHGVDARLDEVLQLGTPIADVLLSRSVDLAADLIVAGVCRHSQLREALLGGVSRGLFHHMTLPVLMSH